jgi:hypothetical protein
MTTSPTERALSAQQQARRQRGVRTTALVVGALAMVIYVLFIASGVIASQGPG